ncbi:uncharacterized protein MONOS_17577 [Monocercomonoides exilis]|uniref:uncharacterized protein n=1 Tax=Monocercomonoides exilis TaxID=2049356 RepID=UPI00355969EF|nr:hypothetical protein MONOS_17577 [Monocercomonoides exilis]
MGSSHSDNQISPLEKKLNDLFVDLDKCGYSVQKLIITEINKVLDLINEDDFLHVVTQKLFDKIRMLVDKKKLPLENALTLLKCIGYHGELNRFCCYAFNNSSLSKKFRNMIIDEERKKEGEKNENLLTDLCECYFLLHRFYCDKEISKILAFYLLKVASNKETSEEAQNKVEMALLAMGKETYPIALNDENDFILHDIAGIIRYHQERRNLSHLAYQSAWFFILFRLKLNEQFEKLWKVFVKDLDFYGEATGELEELVKKLDIIKKEKKEMKEKMKKKDDDEEEEERKLFCIIERWLYVLEISIDIDRPLPKVQMDIMKCIANISSRDKGSRQEIRVECAEIVVNFAKKGEVQVFDLIRGGAVDSMLEELSRSYMIRMMFEKLEGEGLEDIIVSFIPLKESNRYSRYKFSSLPEMFDSFLVKGKVRMND